MELLESTNEKIYKALENNKKLIENLKSFRERCSDSDSHEENLLYQTINEMALVKSIVLRKQFK